MVVTDEEIGVPESRARARFARRSKKLRELRPVDFQQILVTFKNNEYSYQWIANQIGVGKATVSKWASGNGMLYCHGEALIILWNEVFQEEVPRD